MSYTQKYLKYKSKYLNLKYKMRGGAAAASGDVAAERAARRQRQAERRERDAHNRLLEDDLDMPCAPAIAAPTRYIPSNSTNEERLKILNTQLDDQEKALLREENLRHVNHFMINVLQEAIQKTEDDIADVEDCIAEGSQMNLD